MQNHWSEIWPLELNPLKLILASFSVVVMLLLVPSDRSITGLFITIILYIVIFPIGVLYACQDRNTIYFFSVFLCFSLVEFFIQYITPHPVTIKAETGNTLKTVPFFGIVILLLTIVFIFRERGAPSLSSMDFSITYDIRSSYEISSLTSRLFDITTKAIIPVLIATYFLKKKYYKVLALLLIQFAFFLWLANKTTIFSIGVLIAGFLLAKAKDGTALFSRLMCFGIAGISVLEGLTSQIENGISRIIYFAYSLLVRRTLFLPAHLKYSYYDYFVVKGNPLEVFFGTFIAPILTRLGIYDPYENLSYTKIIGKLYMDMDGSNANTGVFGTEIANFGYLGILVAAVLLLLFLICVKKSEATNGRVFTCCIAIYTVFSFSDSGVIRLIDYSPMLLIALILSFYKIGGAESPKPVYPVESSSGIPA